MALSNEAKLPSPWNRFLEELDGLLREQVHLHCIGGFVLSLFYGLPRPTADVDYFAVVPYASVQELQALAGAGSRLARKYKLYLQHVPTISLPEDFGGLLTTPKGVAIAGRFVRVGLLPEWAALTFLTLRTWGKPFGNV